MLSLFIYLKKKPNFTEYFNPPPYNFDAQHQTKSLKNR